MTDTPANQAFIVVGVDGSDASKDALHWAVKQAELTGAELRAVMSWHVPLSSYGAAMPTPIGDTVAAECQQNLDRLVAEATSGGPTAQITTRVVAGQPAPALVQEAEGAALLVVGSRGLGAFAGMLLGSVSNHVVANAPCPVVVVRHTADET